MFEYLGTNWSDSSWSCSSSTSMCRAACTPSISSTLEPWPRPMTSPTPQSRSQRYVQTGLWVGTIFTIADMDITFHGSCFSSKYLRLLFYRPSMAPFWASASLHFERSLPSTAPLESPKLLNFDCNADPNPESDPAFPYDADPDQDSHYIRIRSPVSINTASQVTDPDRSPGFFLWSVLGSLSALEPVSLTVFLPYR